MTVNVSVVAATECNFPPEKVIVDWVKAALADLQPNATLAIRIVDESEMQTMNAQYRQKNKPTNVLSFPCQLPDFLKQDQLGDILICAPIVAKEATDQHKAYDCHFAHMTIHGVLHLLGYDHVKPIEAERMESLETKILQSLGYPDPYGVSLSHE